MANHGGLDHDEVETPAAMVPQMYGEEYIA
jgi:hypothetical protein